MKKAIFFDRDGVLIKDGKYPYKNEHLDIFPEVPLALKELKKTGYMLIVITNQSGVARGLFSEKEVKKFNLLMKKKFEKKGAHIDAIYYCPHHVDGKVRKYQKECNCRKPKPGMIVTAAKKYGISLEDSWMIGNMDKDIIAGKIAGCKTILISTKKNCADFCAQNVKQAAEIIFNSITRGKLINKKKIVEIANIARRANKKIIFTNGCFDILHAGHIDCLEKAKKLGDILIIGLNSDESVKRIKGAKRPINNEMHRARVLSSLSDVDYITIFGENTSEQLVKKIKPDIYVKGGDWKVEKLPEKKIVDKYGGKVVIINVIEYTSTTKIIEQYSRKIDNN